jgi:hypothetical protein
LSGGRMEAPEVSLVDDDLYGGGGLVSQSREIGDGYGFLVCDGGVVWSYLVPFPVLAVISVSMALFALQPPSLGSSGLW